MPLDSLLQLIGTLRTRIDNHRNALRKSEAMTRYALIDPFLRELGWNTDNPEQVIPEYRSDKGSADYALIGEGKPVVIVEAKKLDTPLPDVREQGIQYCVKEGIEHFTVTDGRCWEIFETHKPVPIADKLVTSFDLEKESASEVCLKALALWRQSVQAGQIIAGQAPVASFSTTPSKIKSGGHPDSDGMLPSGNFDWQSLSALDVQKGDARPVGIQLPDGSTAELKAWRGVLLESIRWLLAKNQLKTTDVPFQIAGRYLIATSPVHPNCTPMKSPKQVDNYFVEANFSARDCIAHALRAIEHTGQDPTAIKVRFS